MPVCVAGSLASPHNQSLPYSKADTRKLLTRICEQAWSHGLLHADGSVDTAALAALGTKHQPPDAGVRRDHRPTLGPRRTSSGWNLLTSTTWSTGTLARLAAAMI